MKIKQGYLGFIAVMFLATALTLAPGFTPAAQAAGEDVAMFYDELGQMGTWFEYENYGPVWHPNNVSEEWRPYTDGRWVPTDGGYIFESQEPWGWATYHYGNWMPTEGYGWCWVPGRTWYPSTVDWRTSPENAPVDTSYIGWAPIPPPNYVPPPSYAQPGYVPGTPVMNAVSEPFWVFAQAASFLLGLGQPYTPAYSYGGCGCLAPPTYVPTFFPQTMIVPTYVTPNYYPPAFLGGAFGGAYAWGPPTTYVSRVTNINQTVINNTIINNSTNITNINNVRPPHHVMDKNHHIRDITPPDLVKNGKLPPQKVHADPAGWKKAQANLGKPNIVKTPSGVKPITADIPKVKPVSYQPGQGTPGAGLSTKSTQKITPGMESKIKQLPPNKQITPTKPVSIKQGLSQAGTQPGATGKPGQMPTGVTGKPGQVQPGVTGKPGQVQPGATGKPGQMPPGVTGKPGQVQPGVTGKPGQVQPGATGKPGQMPTGVTGKPGQVQPGVTGKPGQVQPGVTGKPGQVQPGATGKLGQFQPGATGKPGKMPPGVTGKPGQVQPGVTGKPGQVQPGTTGKPGQFQPGTTGKPGKMPPGVTGKPQTQTPPPSGYKSPTTGPGYVKPGTSPASQPKPQPQPQVKPQPKPQPQPQVKPQPKPQPQPQVRPQPQPKPQPQAKPQPQPKPQPQAQPKPQPQPQPQPKPQKEQDKKKQQQQ